MISFELDGQDLTSSPMDINTAYEETMKTFGLTNNKKMNPGIQSFEGWMNDFFCVAYSLSHLGGKPGYLVSGINTQATAMSVAVKVIENGGTANDNAQAAAPLLITEMTSTLQIAPGKSIVLHQ
jgi:hypothetical protein